MVKTNVNELTVLTQLFMDCVVVLVMLSLRRFLTISELTLKPGPNLYPQDMLLQGLPGFPRIQQQGRRDPAET